VAFFCSEGVAFFCSEVQDVFKTLKSIFLSYEIIFCIHRIK
jgi:hypothetical protein